MLPVVFSVPASLVTLYVYCYAGSMMTVHFEELADVVYQSKWYEYDPQIRKCLVLLIANCQKPMVFNGFKLIYLTLNTFARVCMFALIQICPALIKFSYCCFSFCFS